MKKLPKVVIDTNIFISALLGSKKCNFIYEEFKKGKFILITSSDLLVEIEEVIKRIKFNFKKGELEKLIFLIKKRSIIITPNKKINIARDPKDNIVLECGLAAKVDFIVTGDKDLISISNLGKTRIITPSEFSKILKSRKF